MVFGIMFKGFRLLFCNSICRMPTPPGTKRNNGKRQEHADNCRILRKSNANENCQEPPRTDKSQKLTNADLQTTHYSTPSTKLDPPRRTLPTIRGRRCSRRMAHSDKLRWRYENLHEENMIAPNHNKKQLFEHKTPA